MSVQNVKTIRKLYEMWAAEDWDAMLDLVAPEVELHGTIGGLEQGNVSHGPDQIMERFTAENLEIWDEHRIEPTQLIDAGDQVVVLQHETQVGKGSGLRTEIDTATVFDLRDGRITRIQPYMDQAAALAAVGLEA